MPIFEKKDNCDGGALQLEGGEITDTIKPLGFFLFNMFLGTTLLLIINEDSLPMMY